MNQKLNYVFLVCDQKENCPYDHVYSCQFESYHRDVFSRPPAASGSHGCRNAEAVFKSLVK